MYLPHTTPELNRKSAYLEARFTGFFILAGSAAVGPTEEEDPATEADSAMLPSEVGLALIGVMTGRAMVQLVLEKTGGSGVKACTSGICFATAADLLLTGFAST